LPRALAGGIKGIHKGCEVKKIDLKAKMVCLASGRTEAFDLLISTLPLPEMSGVIRDLPSEIRLAIRKLRWNSIFNLNLGLDKNDALNFHWTYFPSPKTCFFRVGLYHNFSPDLAPARMASLYAEVSYSKARPIDKRNIIFRIKADLKKAGLVKAAQIKAEDVNDIKYAYPIYDRNYKAAREKIIAFLKRNNVIACGRYGSWRYMSMEDSILDGVNAAEMI